MDTATKEKIYRYLQDQITQTEFRIKAYIYNERGKKNPYRTSYYTYKAHLDSFLHATSDARWFVIAGLRGAGKTTLLAQLYHALNQQNVRKLYLSVDQIVQIVGVTLQDVLEVYEELIDSRFEQLQEPLLLFLDEVQYDKKWAILLKTIYDRSKKVGIITTGSSAVMLQTNPDVARRAIFEKLFPMTFPEYITMKHGIPDSSQLSESIETIVFQSKQARDVYDQMKSLEKKIRSYWMNIEHTEIERYMRYGALPFMVALNNESLVYEQINKTLDKIISTDIAQSENFERSIIAKVPMILYAIADSDIVSLAKLSTSLAISRPTLITLFNLLEKAEVLFRLYPYGSHYTQIKKPSKYLFTCPAFRAMYFNLIGSTQSREIYKGKLLEDTIGLYINKYINRRPNSSVTFDNREGGADFIVGIGNRHIVIEVGTGSKQTEQIEHTMARVPNSYGICISSNQLHLHEEKNIIHLPFEYFLLS